MVDHVKKYWGCYVILSILLSFLSTYYSKQYDLIPQQIDTIVKGSVVSKTYFLTQPVYKILDIASNLFISFSISLFIALVFIRSFEKVEKEKFEDKILEFQKETAKNAILSTFEQIIDKNYFNIIKQDVLNSPFLRKDIKWQYDISEKDGGLKLIRTVNYTLINLSQLNQKENIHLSYLKSIHCTTNPISLKYRIEGSEKFENVELEESEKDGIGHSLKEGIDIPACKTAEIVFVVLQEFPRDYIYETHFINQAGINLEIIVNKPDGYDFTLSPRSFSSSLETIVNEPTKKMYSLKGAIYRGQGTEFICYKIPVGKAAC